MLIVSGNFSWLNWLTIVLALSVVDGSLIADPHALPGSPLWYEVVVIAFSALLLSCRRLRIGTQRRRSRLGVVSNAETAGESRHRCYAKQWRMMQQQVRLRDR